MSGERTGGGWTRRRFVEELGRLGGAAAAYEGMVALGLLRIPEAYAGPPQIPAEAGQGRTVLVLGAGIGGLTAAYRLRQAGYAPRILEAQGRPGGRSFTVRRHNQIVEVDAEGRRTTQTCRFETGQYFNAGPGRLPHHHQAILDICRELKVPLEVYVMETRANRFQTSTGDPPTPPPPFGGRAVENRQVANDTRGYVAELLAKAVNQGALNGELDADERRQLLGLLTVFGPVEPGTYVYKGSSRSGYDVQPGVTTAGVVRDPLPRSELLKSAFWANSFYQPEDYLWQPTLFEPVGGMDVIVQKLVEALGRMGVQIEYNREVVQIHTGDDQVGVRHRDTATDGNVRSEAADYCISTIPLPILKKIPSNFRDDFREAVGAVDFASTCKVGWQADARFWEVNDRIFGGISYINHPITQFWYPSGGFFREGKAILTGAYNYTARADQFAALSLADRLRVAREGATLLHPEFPDFVPLETGLSIAWKNVPFQNGGWASWKREQTREYRRLLAPERRFWVCGDQVSYLPGWQEGAVLSAHHVVSGIALPHGALKARAAVEIGTVDQAPDAAEVTEGLAAQGRPQ